MADTQMFRVYDQNHIERKAYYPAGLSLAEVDADLQDAGHTRIKGWGEWAADAFIPNTPVGWGIAIGSSIPGIGPLGKISQLGWQGGKLALREAPALYRAVRVATGLGAPVVGGLAGVGVEHALDYEKPTTYSSAALQALVAGLVGQGSTATLNALSRMFFGRQYLAYKADPKSLAEWANSIKAGIAIDPTPRGLATLASRHEFARAADSMIKTELNTVEKLSLVSQVHLPKLGDYLEQAGMERPANNLFSVREAMDAMSHIGPEIWARIGKPSPTKAILDDIRNRTLSEFGQQVGPKAASVHGSALETYGLWMETDRLLGSGAREIFPHEGGVSFDGLQRVIQKRYSDPKTGKWYEDRLGDKYQTLYETAMRGPIGEARMGDVPSRYYLRMHPWPIGEHGVPVTVGESAGAGGKGGLISKFAGDPYLLPYGLTNPISGLPFVTKAGGMIPRPNVPDILQSIPNPFGAKRPEESTLPTSLPQ